jgi:serine/threonine protein kinase/Tfp pilus assembly protein PilF
MLECAKDEKAIFLAALEQASPAERQAYLQGACGGDAALLKRLKVLLSVYEQSDGPLDAPSPVVALAPTANDPITERPGTVIGPYKLLEQIGEGGFGVVFMAEQQQPIRRKIALKILKPGMDTRQVVARFEAERQALAIMDHPNIAKVFDAGQIASSRPYFVMDLVKGLPITDYCDQSQLAPHERLALFVSVCRAVQHAHQKGIIHRDIKPSNVLVTMQDGAPLVKVIDFGIAKAIGQQLTDKTLFTGFAQLIGSPLYMSPEQAALSNVDVDTRSDIYSLGVLLYELLTGTTPFDRQRLTEVDYDEIRRIIRDEEPPKPSTRITTLGQAATTISSQRKSDPKRLSQLCRGELDWMVMKALEKDRNRRYETASAFAADVERYLHNEPVQACPPSVGYRLRKFAQRKKAALVTSALIVLAILLAAGSLGWAVRDRAARDAEFANDQATRLAVTTEKVTQALNDANDLQGQAKWTEALEAAKRAEGFSAAGGSEALRARVRETRQDLEMVLRLEEIRLPRNRPGQAGSIEAARDAAYSQAFQDFGIDVDVLEPAEAAVRIRARPIWLQLTAALDGWADDRRRSRKAEDASWKRRFAVAKAADPDPWRNQVRDALGQGDRKTLHQLAASANVRQLPAQSLSLLVYLGQFDLALEQSLLRQAQRERPDDFWLNFQVAWNADAEDKIRFYTAAIAVRPKNADTHEFLAEALLRRGKRDEAIAEYSKAIELNPNFSRLYNNLAWLLATCAEPQYRNPVRAVELAKKAVELSQTEPGYWNTLGVAHYRAGNWKESIAALEKSERLAPGRYLAFNDFFLSMAHWQLGHKQQARKEYEQALEWMEKKEPKNEELRRFRAEAEGLLKQGFVLPF